MENKKDWTEKDLEDFIKENKDKFDVYQLNPNHEKKFLLRLKKLIKTIVPYLIKVGIAVIIVWVISFLSWRLFLKHDRDRMPLRRVSFECRKTEYGYNIREKALMSELGRTDRKNLKTELRSMDSTYVVLEKELKKNPYNTKIVEAMITYYKKRISIVDSVVIRSKKIDYKK